MNNTCLSFRALQALQLHHHCRPLALVATDGAPVAIPLEPGVANADGPALVAELIRLARFGRYIEGCVEADPAAVCPQLIAALPSPIRWEG